MASRNKVAIVGGGIGGLTAALAMLRHGIDVEVYEQAPELREIGAGLQVSANGTRVLHALGLEPALARVQMMPTGKEIRHWNSGKTWKLFDLGAVSVERYGFPYINIHRGDLHMVLADAVRREKPDAIRLRAKCVRLTQTDDHVTMHFENGDTAQAPVVVGADGVHSAVRQSLFGKDAPDYSGIVAWRGLVPMERVPASIRMEVGTNWVGPGGHVVHYAVRRGELLNFVGLKEEPTWSHPTWIVPADRDQFLKQFDGWHDDIRGVIRCIETPFRWALIACPPMETWSKGRVTLLGDACHSTLPFLAQGAVMALEDGLILARCLQKYGVDYANAFARYEAIRVDRANRAVRGANDNAKRFHNPTLAEPEGAEAYIDREWQEERIRQRYDWLFVYDATTAPV